MNTPGLPKTGLTFFFPPENAGGDSYSERWTRESCLGRMMREEEEAMEVIRGCDVLGMKRARRRLRVTLSLSLPLSPSLSLSLSLLKYKEDVYLKNKLPWFIFIVFNNYNKW